MSFLWLWSPNIGVVLLINPSIYIEIGIIPLLLRDQNVNTSNLMHVLRYPAISKSVISLSILTNKTFWHPFIIIYVFNCNLVFNHFFVISIFSFVNTHLFTYLLAYLLTYFTYLLKDWLTYSGGTDRPDG